MGRVALPAPVVPVPATLAPDLAGNSSIGAVSSLTVLLPLLPYFLRVQSSGLFSFGLLVPGLFVCATFLCGPLRGWRLSGFFLLGLWLGIPDLPGFFPGFLLGQLKGLLKSSFFCKGMGGNHESTQTQALIRRSIPAWAGEPS